jgi:hypothetical protein
MKEIKKQDELNTYYDILFNFNSDVWANTNYNEKKSLLEELFTKTSDGLMDLRLFLMDYESQSFEYVIPENSTDINDYRRPIVIQIDLWDKYFFVGLYLNKSIVPESPFPLMKIELDNLKERINQLNDKRKSLFKKINKEIFDKDISTRELFDFSSSQGERSSPIEKREKLINLNKAGVQPIEVLFFHHIIYSEQDTSMNPGDSVYDAFDLCWYNGKIL